MESPLHSERWARYIASVKRGQVVTSGEGKPGEDRLAALMNLVASAPEPAANQPADLVNRLGGEAVALDPEALQVLGQPHLEAEWRHSIRRAAGDHRPARSAASGGASAAGHGGEGGSAARRAAAARQAWRTVAGSRRPK